MNMNGLEAAASATLGVSLIPFISAWDVTGKAGRKYRATVKRFAYFPLIMATLPAGMVCYIVARIGAWLDPRPLNSETGMKSYLWRRRYEGDHFSGISSRSIVARLTRETQARALAT